MYKFIFILFIFIYTHFKIRISKCVQMYRYMTICVWQCLLQLPIRQINMRQPVECKALCQPKAYKLDDKKSMTKLKRLERAIKLDYMHHWFDLAPFTRSLAALGLWTTCPRPNARRAARMPTHSTEQAFPLDAKSAHLPSP